jgi:Helix-turn-helix
VEPAYKELDKPGSDVVDCRIVKRHTASGRLDTPFAEVMKQRSLTNRDLARGIGATESYVSLWRNGLRPGPGYRKKLIRRLKLSPAELRVLGWPEAEDGPSV